MFWVTQVIRKENSSTAYSFSQGPLFDVYVGMIPSTDGVSQVEK